MSLPRRILLGSESWFARWKIIRLRSWKWCWAFCWLRKRSGPAANRSMTVSSPMKVHFSSRGSEWTTPTWLYDALNTEFHFTLDPCATPENARCQQFFTAQQDGLAQDWGRHAVF